MSIAYLFRPFLRLSLAVVFMAVVLSGCGGGGGGDFFEVRENTKFEKAVDEYIAGYAQANPVEATAAGIHDYDAEIGLYSSQQIFEERRRLNSALESLDSVLVRFLYPDNKMDYQILDYHIRGQLVDLEDIGLWARDPAYYDNLITRGIDKLIQHDFAPFDQRLRAVIARLEKVPDVFQAAQENISYPPRVLVEISIEQLNSSLSYFRETLPAMIESVEDSALAEDFNAANETAVAAYEDFIKFLRDVDFSRSSPFYIGRTIFESKLLYSELIEIPFNDLLGFGEAQLEKSQQMLADKAKEIDADKDVEAVLADLYGDSPDPENILTSMAEAIETARQFVADRDLVTLPAAGSLSPQAMPPFQYTARLVGLEMPGAMESSLADSYLRVYLPGSDWRRRDREAHMRSLNLAALQLMAVHQAFPGRYVHSMGVRQNASKVRRIAQLRSFSDGWARYAEGLMVEEGYRQDDPRVALEQMRLTVTAMARLVATMRLHTNDLSYFDVVDFLEEEGHLEAAEAEREAGRALRDPMAALAGLGKLLITRMRDEATQGGVSLKDFHDRLLRDALPPGIHSLGTWSKPELRPDREGAGQPT